MYRFSALIVLLSLPVSVSAQSQTDAGKPSASTKLEAFSSRTGVVIIRGYSTVGTVNGMGSVSIQAREFREASNPRTALYGVVITVKESGRLERDSFSYVDEDEIEALIQGLEYIKQIDKTVTSLGGFEAEFRTRGDLSMIVFSSTQLRWCRSDQPGSVQWSNWQDHGVSQALRCREGPEPGTGCEGSDRECQEASYVAATNESV